MKIGLISDSFRLGFEDSIKAASKLGVSGVQKYMTFGDFTADTLTPSRVKEVRDFMESNGLVFSAICGDFGMDLDNDMVVDLSKRVLEKAKELGLKDTRFSNPHGLPAENHFTSAADLARLTDYALQNELFAEIVSTKKMAACEGARYYVNHNRLLFSYEGMIGVKTGYTQASGRCLVTAARRYGRTLICVTLNDYYCSADHVRMLDSGFSSTD